MENDQLIGILKGGLLWDGLQIEIEIILDLKCQLILIQITY